MRCRWIDLERPEGDLHHFRYFWKLNNLTSPVSPEIKDEFVFQTFALKISAKFSIYWKIIQAEKDLIRYLT